MKTMLPPFTVLHLSAAAACAVLSTATFAQAPAPGSAPTAPSTTQAPPAKLLNPMEKNFVRNTGKVLQYIIALGDSAMTRGAFADPKEALGRLRGTVEKDGKKAFEALSKIAQAHQEILAAGVGGSDKLSIERMGRLKDDKFSKEWLGDLVKESRKLDRDFEQAAKTSQDPDLKSYAVNYGPLIHNIFLSAEGAETGLKKK